MHDWLIFLLPMVIGVVLNVIEPFHRFVGQDMTTDLMYPLQGNTVPFWGVSLVVILLPMAIIAGIYFYRRDVYDWHHAILGLLFSVLVPGILTDAIKDAVGRPRPVFFWRCFPDGKGVFDTVTKIVQCTGEKKVINEGHKSFPSGHTSWSFAGLGFLAWYLAGKIRVFDCKGHVAKLCLLFLSLLVASLVGVFTRMTVASICYLQFFPPPYDTDGWGPFFAYFQTSADSRPAGVQPSSSMNNYNDMQLNNAEYGRFNDHETERPQHPTVAQNVAGLFRLGSSLSQLMSLILLLLQLLM
ncbi:hypothetical protein MKX01_028544 [Papaver californicum]|nr:hypothetical protein MKX01_028544 [Papaver californicum]